MGRATKVPAGGRLLWFDEAPSAAYWSDHWADRVAEGYLDDARTADLEADPLGRRFLPHLGSDRRVLEAGCGPGWWVAALAARGHRAEGIELSPAVVDRVHAVDPDLAVRVGDALAIDAPAETYDAYLSIGVIEHREEGPEPFLAEAHRVLVDGGLAIVAVPSFGPFRRLRARLHTYQRDAGGTPFHQYGFRRRELEALVKAAGFDVVGSSYYGGHRMLTEEVPGYRRLTLQRGGERIKAVVERLLDGRDGHMVLVLGRRR